MRPLIISQRVDFIRDRQETRDSLDQRLVNFFNFAGFLGMPVPNCFIQKDKGDYCYKALDQWIKLINPQGIVLSGGNDIGNFINRDLTEIRLIQYAQKNKLPLLGICRGMQMIAHYSGVKLHKVEGHANTRHFVHGAINQFTNSFHNFSINNCPDDFSLLAKSEDNEIEAIRHNLLPWECWMWHPEREKIFNNFDIERTRQLFNI